MIFLLRLLNKFPAGTSAPQMNTKNNTEQQEI
jgi:hypothetical protein